MGDNHLLVWAKNAPKNLLGRQRSVGHSLERARSSPSLQVIPRPEAPRSPYPSQWKYLKSAH